MPPLSPNHGLVVSLPGQTVPWPVFTMVCMRLNSLVVLGLCVVLAACSPELNWRDIGFEGARLKAQLPCKPDRTTRQVAMGSSSVPLQVAGCPSAGAMLAVMTTLAPMGSDPQALLLGWQQATLDNARARIEGQQAWQRPGLLPLPASMRVSARALDAQGQPLQMQAVWGALPEGERVRLVHAVVYGQQADAELVQTLFDSLRP